MTPIAGLEQAERTTVLVHAEDRFTRTGLLGMLSAGPRITPVLTAEGTDVDVVLVASTSLTSSLMRQLRSRTGPRPPSVLVLDQLGDADVFGVLELGVRAVLWRPEATGERLLHTIRLVRRGGVLLPAEVQQMLVDAVVRVQQNVLTPRRLTASGLEDREIDVIRLVAQGLDTAEVARRLAYSERTVKTILAGMISRLNLRSRSHAVAYAIRSGVL
ncbi:response regulator transcription factor [Kineosporia sp. J2-2]|uniref:Response regulator transcription factor n=1 Tax=Kineosporia corallincola TaxID=2835133 RepID=A0ABS5TGJ9_9ACTN|nr:response regulator transcription factor [Kineosporia corallincola]MBT0770212.1 response regulator transcription factor [Kineosporia corallincola]